VTATKTAIAQMALGHLGIADTITDVDTDQTAVSRAMRTYYDVALRQLLEAQPWAFATRYYDFIAQAGSGTVTVTLTNTATFSTSQDGTLNVGDTITIGTTEYVIGARTSGTVWATSGANVAGQTFTIAKAVTDDPTEEWEYAYRIPSKIQLPRKLVDGNRTPIRSNRPSFRIGSDSTGKLLYCDWNDPVVLEYTEEITDVTQYPERFVFALSALLAFLVAPLVTGGDPNGLGNRAYQVFRAALEDAASTDANQNVPDDDPEAELTQFRNGVSFFNQESYRYRLGY
jgi:hypothetical protein